MRSTSTLTRTLPLAGQPLLRLVAWLAIALFAAGATWAQPTEEAIDPPARVGSVTLLAGPVTMVDLATGTREDALLNWPVTGGWRIETARAGRAEVRIGSTALRLDDETTVDFARVDDNFMQIAVLRGSVSLRLRNREILNELELLTQRERIVFDEAGSYRIDVDRLPGTTAVTAFTGRLRLAVGGSSFVVAAGQRGEVSATPAIRFQIVAAAADRFDDWAAARDSREDAIRSASYVSRETTGVELLDEYGEWRTVEEYGAVWFPRAVASNWAPFRYGRWVWLSPWGWTWIDEAPWGFAPLHYGRWVVVGGTWGWFPGVVVARPVYAPALVAWYGVPGVSVGVGAPVGWFPLGPREPYVPAFRHSPRYLRVVNVQHVPNVEAVTIVQAPRYVHRHPDRSTWVPDDRFGRPEPVHRGQRPPPSEWRQYIARPQPPANVPSTKRRQAVEGVAAGTPAAAPGPATDTRPAVRAPSVIPRAVEAPRAQPMLPPPSRPAPAVGADEPPSLRRPGEAPRSEESPRRIDEPQARPPVPGPRADPAGSRGDSPAARGDERRMSPRAPMPSMPKPVPTPSMPHSAPTLSTPPPAPMPSTQPPAAVVPPGFNPGTPPRSAMPSRPQPPPGEAWEPRGGRGDGGVFPRDGHRQAPRTPAAPDRAGGAPPTPVAPPVAAPPPPREATPTPPPSRAAPPAREGGEPGGTRPGRAPLHESAH